MFGSVSREYENVIQVHEDKVVEEVLQNVIDHGLEDSWSISETKRHD